MAQVTFRTLKTKQVKNLGWLLKHANQIDHLSFIRDIGSQGVLKAYAPEFLFEADFASFIVLWKWLNRPVFQNKLLVIPGPSTSRNFVIGDEQYNILQKLPIPAFLNQTLR